MKKLTLAALAATACVSSVPANAAYLFEYTAYNSKTAEPNLSFKLSETPTPSAIYQEAFQIDGVNATICTNAGCTAQTGEVTFWTVDGGGLFNSSVFNFDLYGDKVFKGDLTAPTFVTGTFTAYDDGNYTTAIGTVVITDVGVPEPASWALMISGFGLIGAATRRRRSLVTA